MSVHRLPSGRWQVRWRCPGVPGQQSKVVDNRGDAGSLDRAIKKLGGQILKSDPRIEYLTLIGAPDPRPGRAKASVETKAKGTTLGKAIDLYAERPGNSENTTTAYRHLRTRLGSLAKVTVAEVTQEEIDRLFKRLQKEYAPNTVYSMVINLHAALALYDRGDAMAGVKGRYEAETLLEAVYLTPEQRASLIETAHLPKYAKHNMALFCEFILETGLRLGEALAVQVKHLDLDAAPPQIKVRHAVSGRAVRSDGFAPVRLKTKHAKREVTVSSLMAKKIAKAVEGRSPDATVLRPAYAGWWLHCAVETTFRSLCQDAPGVPDHTRIHDLRHTRAKTLLDAGADLSRVSRFLGHANVGITAKVYDGYDITSLASLHTLMDLAI